MSEGGREGGREGEGERVVKERNRAVYSVQEKNSHILFPVMGESMQCCFCDWQILGLPKGQQN